MFGEMKESQNLLLHSTSVKDNNYEILVVSNFTLYGFLKGNKPDFHNSMNAE